MLFRIKAMQLFYFWSYYYQIGMEFTWHCHWFYSYPLFAFCSYLLFRILRVYVCKFRMEFQKFVNVFNSMFQYHVTEAWHGSWKEVGCSTTCRRRPLQLQAPALPLWDDLRPRLSLGCRIGRHLRSQVFLLGMSSRYDPFPDIHPFTEQRIRCSYITAKLPSRIVCDGI